MNRYAFILAMASIIAHLMGCSGPTNVADGSSSETVIGTVRSENGEPGSGASVILIISDYNPADAACGECLRESVCDANGVYTFLSVKQGTYHILATHSSGITRAIVKHTVTGNGSSTGDDAVLKAPGTIRIQLPDSSDSTEYCYLAGTPYYSSTIIRTDGAAYVEIDSVPAYKGYSAQLVGADWQSSKVEIEGAQASSGVVSVYQAPAHGWRFSSVLRLNTTASGANVDQTVTNLPVLVRLTSSSFDFSQAHNAGNDLRFAGKSGTDFSYQIERWDSAAGKAEIWVAVDSVIGNATTPITMSWGNPTAPGVSSGPSVFDTAHGFCGVWHLSEEAGGKGNSDIFRDATANRFHGTDHVTATGRDGIAGPGHEFGGKEDADWIDLGPDRAFLNEVSGATLEAWVRLDQAGGSNSFLSHSVGAPTSVDSSRALLITNDNGKTAAGGRSTDVEPSQAAADADTLTAGIWHHLAGVIDYAGDSIAIYVDGIHKKTNYVSFPAAATPATVSQNSAIGASDSGRYGFFDGHMDEVRTQKVVRDAAWIRLNYENQKANQTLVEIP